MRGEIARLQRRLGTTTIYVTHDQTEAMTLGDRIAVMRYGVIQQTGTPRELYAQPRNLFVAGFLGSPAMNLLPAELRDGRIHLPLPGITLEPAPGTRQPAEPGRLVAGLRPEHFRLAEASAAGFEVNVELAEWLGADLLVHFRLEAETGAQWPGLDTAGEKRPGPGLDLVARLDGSCRARAGDTLRLAVTPAAMVLFDAITGQALGTAHP